MKSKNSYPNVLMIGANQRKVGKTSLIETILHHFRQDNVIAIKIAAYDNKDALHRHHPEADELLFIEEKEGAETKDSRRYLKAGAGRSFFVAGLEDKVKQQIETLLNTFANKAVLVESNWFALNYKPGYILLLNDKTVQKSKKSFEQLKPKANAIVPPGTIGELTMIHWRFEDGRWHIPG